MKKNKKAMPAGRQGFTLVELLIVMAILVIMAVILIGILNPIALVGKANDATRKKDLDRIKKSFEEYFNDSGVYPMDIGDWNIKENCDSNTIFNPYLTPWPCDPDGEPYYITVSNNGKSFIILSRLENKNDSLIPNGWYENDSHNSEDFNYGVSSSNISWQETFPIGERCTNVMGCFILPIGRSCNSTEITTGCGKNVSDDCYVDNNCTYDQDEDCRVDCCGNGCN